MTTVQVELAIGIHGTWDEEYSRPARNRDLVSAPPDVVPSPQEGCLQNIIVDMRAVPPSRLGEMAGGIVNRVAGVEVTAESILSCADALKALEVDSAQTWVDLSEGEERIIGLLAGGWAARPRNTGISVRSPSLDSVRTWSRVAEAGSLPLRFIWESHPAQRDTLRVLTSLGVFAFSRPPAVLGIDPGADPSEKVESLLDVVSSGLRELGLRRPGIQLISCPACARSKVDLRRIAAQVSEALGEMQGDLCVAVMGCEVNGPGEARLADLGVACGKGIGLIFREGKIIRKVSETEIVTAMVEEAGSILKDRSVAKQRKRQ